MSDWQVEWLPEVEDQTSHHPWLGGLPLWDIVEKQFTVRDHSERSLPALLHPAWLWDLNREMWVRDVEVLYNYYGVSSAVVLPWRNPCRQCQCLSGRRCPVASWPALLGWGRPGGRGLYRKHGRWRNTLQRDVRFQHLVCMSCIRAH